MDQAVARDPEDLSKTSKVLDLVLGVRNDTSSIQKAGHLTGQDVVSVRVVAELHSCLELIETDAKQSLNSITRRQVSGIRRESTHRTSLNEVGEMLAERHRQMTELVRAVVFAAEGESATSSLFVHSKKMHVVLANVKNTTHDFTKETIVRHNTGRENTFFVFIKRDGAHDKLCLTVLPVLLRRGSFEGNRGGRAGPADAAGEERLNLLISDKHILVHDVEEVGQGNLETVETVASYEALCSTPKLIEGRNDILRVAHLDTKLQVTLDDFVVKLWGPSHAELGPHHILMQHVHSVRTLVHSEQLICPCENVLWFQNDL